jgi:hypothetical protein
VCAAACAEIYLATVAADYRRETKPPSFSPATKAFWCDPGTYANGDTAAEQMHSVRPNSKSSPATQMSGTETGTFASDRLADRCDSVAPGVVGGRC